MSGNDAPRLNQGTAGNVSTRFENGMLITPSGIPMKE
ncbi:class II aldolase/adducin family protein [Escherichia coli]